MAYDIGPQCGGLGTPLAPAANVAPAIGVAPHTLTAFEGAAVVQFSEFLKLDGAFVDTCGADPCYAAGWSGS